MEVQDSCVKTFYMRSVVSKKIHFLLESCRNSRVKFHVSFMFCVFDDWGVVTLEQGLHEKSCGADHAHTYKNPQEETVNHHGHIFPVFNDLQKIREIIESFHYWMHSWTREWLVIILMQWFLTMTINIVT